MGNTRQRKGPRRKPRQSRARALVDAVVESGERLLTSDGYGRLSTKRIAELAGVSIGSLYQYFPRKEAIIGKLIDDRLEDDLAELRQVIEECRELDFEDTAERLVTNLVPISVERQAFLKEIVQVLERTERLEVVQHTMDRIASEIAIMLRERTDELRPGLDPEYAAHCLVWGGRAVMLARLRVEEELDVERLRRELLRIAQGYLGWKSKL